jgi:hypothetical protein
MDSSTTYRSFRLSRFRPRRRWWFLVPMVLLGAPWAYCRTYENGVDRAIERAVGLTAAGDTSPRLIVHLDLADTALARQDFRNAYATEGFDHIFLSYYAHLRFPSGRVYHVDVTSPRWRTWEVWLSNGETQ